MNTTSRGLPVLAVALVASACAAETTDPNAGRTSQTTTPKTEDPPVPPGAAGNDGRVDSSSMCFATCSNVSFSCKGTQGGQSVVFTAQMTYEMPGCNGTISKGVTPDADNAVKVAIDCSTRKICLGATPGADATSCTQGTFSAFSFSFTNDSAGQNVVCTRD